MGITNPELNILDIFEDVEYVRDSVEVSLVVYGDVNKAEAYCGRAILACPSDANMLALYADIIWQSHRDAQRAETYFKQAGQFAPDDWRELHEELGVKLPEDAFELLFVFLQE